MKEVKRMLPSWQESDDDRVGRRRIQVGTTGEVHAKSRTGALLYNMFRVPRAKDASSRSLFLKYNISLKGAIPLGYNLLSH